MTSAIETCPCGAKIDIRDAGTAELRERLNDWRTDHKHPEPVKEEHHPEGNVFTAAERIPDIRPHHLNADERPHSPYGRGISLKWKPSDGGLI